jgi:hypothetical protein
VPKHFCEGGLFAGFAILMSGFLESAMRPNLFTGGLFLIGCLFIGGSVDMWLNQKAKVQNAGVPINSSSQSSEQSKDVPLIEKFTQNVTSYNQQGGITAGNVNIATQRLMFFQELGAELLEKMPVKKKVFLKSIGGATDQAVADEIQSFLQKNGYPVERNITGMMAPPPDNKISLTDGTDGYLLIVAPSAN